MKLLLIDPGLLNRHGHHFHVDYAVFEECRARGMPATLLANREVDQEIAALVPLLRVFEATAYPSRDGYSDRDLAHDFEVFNKMVERDLLAASIEPLGLDDLVLVPTARDIHLTGILRWYQSLPEPRPRICIRLLFLPWFRATTSEREFAVQLSAQQLQEWAQLNGGRVFFAAESRRLADYFERLSGLQVGVLPLPIRYPRPDPLWRSCAAEGAPHIVYLGEARREKGFHLLANALRPVAERWPQARFSVQAGCLFDVAQAEVERITALSPNVRIITEPLALDTYDDPLCRSDVVLVAYDPAQYALRTSQVFLEALGLGKVVLATRGTWMHDYLTSLELADLGVDAFTSDAIKEAIERVLMEWDNVSMRVSRAADESRRRHGSGRFMAELLRLIGASGAARTAT